MNPEIDLPEKKRRGRPKINRTEQERIELNRQQSSKYYRENKERCLEKMRQNYRKKVTIEKEQKLKDLKAENFYKTIENLDPLVRSIVIESIERGKTQIY